MPVEIKELIVKATVSSNDDNDTDKPRNSGLDKNEIIRACVEEVMNILERNRER